LTVEYATGADGPTLRLVATPRGAALLQAVFRRLAAGERRVLLQDGAPVDTAAAGLDQDEKATAHVLRYTFATSLVRGGTDLVTVAELLGHGRLETVRVHTQPTEEDKIRLHANRGSVLVEPRDRTSCIRGVAACGARCRWLGMHHPCRRRRCTTSCTTRCPGIERFSTTLGVGASGGRRRPARLRPLAIFGVKSFMMDGAT
jgi:hypothetical protein